MEDLHEIKKIISIVVYGIISLILATLILRVFLMLIGASTDSPFVVLMYSMSENFIAPFRGIYPSIQANGGHLVLETFMGVALIFYIMLGYLISKSIRSFIDLDPMQILINLIDAAFKFAEILLITRFIFKLSSASTSSEFVRIVYDTSAIIYEPFQNILPGITIPSLGIIFETSTLIAIIAIIIFDSISEGILAQLRSKKPVKQVHLVHPAQPTVVHVQSQTPAPAPQNITIQMPTQPAQPQYIPMPQPQYIDQRSIHMVPPNAQIPQHPNYPYNGQNDLEHNRPPQQLPGQHNNQAYYNPFNGEPMAPRNDHRSGQN